jgi:hypothetical protein
VPLEDRFALAPKEDWDIDHLVKPTRRHTLLGEIPFDRIVARICSEAKLLHIHGPENGGEGDKIGLHRWSITLQASAEAIDLWHNSRGGYRAQYYAAPDKGEAANSYALEQLLARAAQLVRADPYRRFRWARASVSIFHPYARVWIHQGLWCRHKRISERLLHVQRWEIDPSDDPKTQDRKILGSLMPEGETKLEVIGQWLFTAGQPSATPPKPARADHIYKCGFT